MNQRTMILVLGMAAFTVMADNWVVSPILPAIASGIGVPVARAGLLITAYMIPFGAAQLVFGPLADRFGKREVITLTMVLFTVGTALTAIGTSLFDLGVYRLITGVFAASVIPVSIALIGDLVPMPERQAAIGVFLGMAFLGQGLSMAIGGSIAYFLSWRGVFFTYALLSVVITILLFIIGRQVPPGRNPGSEFLKPYWRLLTGRSGRTYLIALTEGVFILGQFSYLGGFIEHTFHFNNLWIGLIMTAFGAAAIVGSRSSGRLAQRIGRQKVLLLGFGLTVAASAAFWALGSILAVFVVGVGVLGLGTMLAHSTILTMGTEFAASARGAATSLVAFCFMGGGGVGTAVGSKVVGACGYPTLFLSFGIGLVLLVVLTRVLMSDLESGHPGV